MPESEHLFWSYRLAKFEVVGERRGVGHVAYAQYEEHLPQNLAELSARIERDGLFANTQPGRAWMQPKEAGYEERGAHRPHIQPVLSTMSVRVLLEPTPEFATCEARWLQRYGVVLDGMLSDNCMANRIRFPDGERALKSDGPSIFRPWVRAYRIFRQRPIALIRSWLEKGFACTLTRIDIASFFDNIDPAFMVDPAFVDAIPFSDRRTDRDAYTRDTSMLLSKYREYWAAVRSGMGIGNTRGVPIGSLTARLIANLALARLDTHVVSRRNVLYYARYVDDIVIVDQNEAPVDLKAGLARLLPLAAGLAAGRLEIDPAAVRRPGSRFPIQSKKVRQDRLEGAAGMARLSAIVREFEKLASFREHFLEPRAANDDFDTGEPTSSAPLLREEDTIALTKQHVTLVADKVTTAAAMLPPEEAAKVSRSHFQHVLPQLTDRWADYLDIVFRVLGTALASHDMQTTHDVSNQLGEKLAAFGADGSTVRVRWRERPIPLQRAHTLLSAWVLEQYEQVLCVAHPLNAHDNAATTLLTDPLLAAGILEDARSLILAGLRLVDRERDIAMGAPRLHRDAEWQDAAADVFDTPQLESRMRLCRSFLDVCARLEGDAYVGLSEAELLLHLEPPTYADVLLRWLRTDSDIITLHDVVNALRSTTFETPAMTLDGDILRIDSDEQAPEVVRVILGHLSTDAACWTASLTHPTLTAERLERLWRVINRAIDEARRAARLNIPALLVLPELCLPQRWLREVTRHLLIIGRTVKLSLVVGLEYSVSGNDVFNEVIAFFPRHEFAAAGWIWTKRRPAYPEKRGLPPPYVFATRREAQRFVTIESEHGRFIPLICSELLEVDSRAELLGRIETLIVPSWNQDTTTFEHVVNACALDLHAFVAVSNNGIFSDARARGPFKESWQREVCRLISRDANDIVTADLPIARLREYQDDAVTYDTNSQNDPMAYPGWKPVPPGWHRR